MLVFAVALFVRAATLTRVWAGALARLRAVTLARKRQVAASPLQSGIEHQREEAAELRNRLRHLPEDEEWRQREHLQAIADQIKDDWVSRLYKLFSDMGALELRDEFMRIGGPSGAEMYQREPQIRFLDDAIALLDRMQKRLARQH